MASSKLIIIIFSNFCLTILFSKIGADIFGTHNSADGVALDIQLDSLIQSNTQEKIGELEIKDEATKWMDDNIRERSVIIELLLNNLLAVHMNGSLDDKEQVHKAQARINELETKIANLSKETEKLSQKRDALESLAGIADKKNSELNSKLESLTRTNNELKIRNRKTERALQVAEEELIKAMTRETTFFRELIEVQESWFPHWLSVQWKANGSPMLDLMFQKKAEFDKWAEPHIETVKTKWIPFMKKQSSRIITQIEPQNNLLTTKTSNVFHASKKSLKPHVGNLQELADPLFQELLKFTKPHVDQVVTIAKPHVDSVNIRMKPYTEKISRSYTDSLEAFTSYHLQLETSIREFLSDELTEALKIVLFLASAFMASQIIFRKTPDNPLQRSNSHESVAMEDGYLERTGSGNYSGELIPKVKKRKIMSYSFDAQGPNNDNNSQLTKYEKEAEKTYRKDWITRSRSRKAKLAEHPANNEESILHPPIKTTNDRDECNVTLIETQENIASQLLDHRQLESDVVDKNMCPKEDLLHQKKTLNSLLVPDRDKSPVVSGSRRARQRSGEKKSETSNERSEKQKKEKESKWCGRRVCILC